MSAAIPSEGDNYVIRRGSPAINMLAMAAALAATGKTPEPISRHASGRPIGKQHRADSETRKRRKAVKQARRRNR